MSANSLVIRETVTLTPSQLLKDFEHPELIRVLLKKAQVSAIDIGSLAYTERKMVLTNSMIAARLPTPVCLKTLRPERREILLEILNFIAMGNNEISTNTALRQYKYALNWCDTNNHSNLFKSAEDARKAYQALTENLTHRLLVLKNLKVRPCYYMQRALKQLLNMKFKNNLTHIIAGIKTFKLPKGSSGSIPPEEHIRQATRTARDLSEKLSSTVLENKQLPLSIEINGSLCSFTPVLGRPYLTPYNGHQILAYNRETNSLFTTLEISKKFGLRKSEAQKRHDGFATTTRLANDDPRSPVRMRLAMLAADAYAQLFLYLTGATPSEFIKFDFDNAVAVAENSITKQLKSIKFRAGGKLTRYSISAKNGVPLLRKYLQLRNWILDGQESPYLFFKLNSKSGTPVQLTPQFQANYFNKLHGTFLPDGTTNIPPSTSRKIKNIALHTLNENPEIIAKSLNHTTETNLNYYSHQTIDRQRNEFSTYWAAVHKAAELINIDGTGFSVPSGQCSDYQHPRAKNDELDIQPSCSNQLGCLYCVHYSCHADEEDTFKLLSAQYVIDALQSSSIALPGKNNIIDNISEKLCELTEAIAAISKSHKQMVDRIRHKVFTLGILTPFWENRMVRFESVGLVI